MSEVSVLSHEYRTAAEFSQRVNWALIQLKKSSLGFTENDSSTKDETFASREELAVILEDILYLLNPEKGARLESAGRVPGALIASLLKERRGDLDDLLDDLERLAQKLHDPGAQLSPEDFNLLDSIAGAADAQTSQVFRRLMRK